MRVQVDFDRCDSNGLCAAVAPEIFEVNDDDLLHVLNEHPPRDAWAAAEAAAQACPKLAISLVEQ